MTFSPTPHRRQSAFSVSAGCFGFLAVLIATVAIAAVNLALLGGAVYVVVWVLQTTGVIS